MFKVHCVHCSCLCHHSEGMTYISIRIIEEYVNDITIFEWRVSSADSDSIIISEILQFCHQ